MIKNGKNVSTVVPTIDPCDLQVHERPIVYQWNLNNHREETPPIIPLK